jgi:Dyp-type peroxidase family
MRVRPSVLSRGRGAARLDLEDIQGNIVRGYGFPHARYTSIRIEDPDSGRAFLGEIEDPVTTAEEWVAGKPPWCLNVAISFEGLRRLGVPETVLWTFPTEFREGMLARAEQLGDVGPSGPEHWDPGLDDRACHILVTVHGRSAARCEEEVGWVHERVTSAGGGLEIVHEQPAAMLEDDREHFGFSDGMAQPSIEGSGVPDHPGNGVPLPDGTWRPLKAGEFLLGYEDEDGILPEAPPHPLGHNSTYVVVRKLHQDVALWRRFIAEAGASFPGGPELLAAKIVGRWPDGTPLVLAPERPDPAIANDPDRVNDFRYADDPEGLRCPLGAHVRRTYPRDALGWGGVMSIRHRMVRRGLPYGPPLPPGSEDDGEDRGLMFVSFQASIERQFEVVQEQWCNDGNAFRLGADRDFLLGDPNGEGKMTVQGSPPHFIAPQQPFVTIRGGGYLLAPGMEALRALAAGTVDP